MPKMSALVLVCLLSSLGCASDPDPTKAPEDPRLRIAEWQTSEAVDRLVDNLIQSGTLFGGPSQPIVSVPDDALRDTAELGLDAEQIVSDVRRRLLNTGVARVKINDSSRSEAPDLAISLDVRVRAVGDEATYTLILRLTDPTGDLLLFETSTGILKRLRSRPLNL